MVPDQHLENNLRELIETDTYKWIFIGGKGGVGKTTTSCAIAALLAQRRPSVLLLSTDPAHNLGDAFGQKFGNSPSRVNGFSNLYAMEMDSSFTEFSAFHLDEDESWFKVVRQLLQSLPGIDEALSFTQLMQYVQTMEFSVIVFDTAPTGHTLRLLSFPETLENGLGKFMQLKNKFGGLFEMMGPITFQKTDEAKVSSKLDALKAVTTVIRETFQDPSRTTFVCVCIAEFLSVYETERLVQELTRHNVDCSNIVVNQVLFPTESGEIPSHQAFSSITPDIENLINENKCLRERLKKLETFYLCRRRMQSKYLSQIVELYSDDFHVVCMKLQNSEVRGVDAIQEFGADLLESRAIPILDSEE